MQLASDSLLKHWKDLVNCDIGSCMPCMSRKAGVLFTRDLLHFCNSYFICSVNLAPFKRHINHASSCFGWQPFFFLEFSPYIDIYDKSVTLRQEKFKLEKFTLTLMSLESWATPAIWIMLFNTFQFYWLPIITRRSSCTHIFPRGTFSFLLHWIQIPTLHYWRYIRCR